MSNQTEFWTTSDLTARYGRSARSLHNWSRTRGFPRPMFLGGHGVEARWRARDILDWEERQAEKARQPVSLKGYS